MLLSAPVHADELGDVTKLLRAGKVAEAMNKTNEFLAKRPNDPQLRFMKGVLLTEQNKSDEAIAVFTRLTEDFKDLPEPYNNLAVLYAASGQYDKARVALEKAIRTNPSYMTAYENLGDVYGKMASQAYDKALALGSTPPPKSKLTLLRTFSSSTGSKVTVPEVPAQTAPAAPPPTQVAQAGVKLISPLPEIPKTAPMQRIPSLAVSPPPAAAPAAAKPAPAAVAAVAVKPEAAKPVPPAPAPVVAAAPALPKPATPAPAAAAPKPPVPAPAPAIAAAKPEAPKPAPVVAAAKVEPPKAAPAVALAAATVAAVAPAPAKPAAKPAVDNSERDDVEKRVNAWAKAWTAQDVDGYLGYYSNEFDPPKGLSRKAWADERRARIAGKGRIRVQVSGVQVTIDGNTAKVTFRQVYESDRLSANSRKTLLMVKQGGKWQIKQETSGG